MTGNRTGESKVKMVCGTCGSENVMMDAWACWDVAKQEWVLHSTFDQEYCGDCDGETHIKEIDI